MIVTIIIITRRTAPPIRYAGFNCCVTVTCAFPVIVVFPFETGTVMALLATLHPGSLVVTLINIELFICPLITIFVATNCGVVPEKSLIVCPLTIISTMEVRPVFAFSQRKSNVSAIAVSGVRLT